MAYNFTDRMKEWTSYVGIVAAGLAAVLPQLVPADQHWVQVWQAAQMFIGGALIFIPQTAGTTAVENDSWTLLRAFAAKAPPAYATAMQPLLATLAVHLAKAENGMSSQSAMPIASAVPPAPAVVVPPVQEKKVFATPVPAPGRVSEPQAAAPLVADPASALAKLKIG